jgi:hypothetical protein
VESAQGSRQRHWERGLGGARDGDREARCHLVRLPGGHALLPAWSVRVTVGA